MASEEHSSAPAAGMIARLPSDLLQMCFGHLAADARSQQAALAASKPLGRALLLGTLQRKRPARLRLDVERASSFLAGAKVLLELVGDVQQHGFTLEVHSIQWTGPLWDAGRLGASQLRLTCIMRLELRVRAAL